MKENRYETILRAIGDGVIVTDAEGRIELLNPAAEALTGWSDAEARGRPLDEIFRIIDEDTRAEVEAPLARIQRQGRVMGLANHTLLIAKDGSERPILDSGAPILDRRGAFAGVVVVFRDQTTERQAQRMLAAAHALSEDIIDTVRQPLVVIDQETRLVRANRAFYSECGGSPEMVGRPLHEVGNRKCDMPALWAQLQEVFGSGASLNDFEVQYTSDQGTRGTMVINARRLQMELEGAPMVLLAIEDVTERRRAEAEKEKLRAQLAQAQKMEALGRLAGGVAHDFNNMLTVILGHVGFARDALEAGHAVRENLAQIQKAAERAAGIVRQLLAFARQQVVSPRLLDINEAIEGTLKMLRRLVGEDIELLWKPGAGVWPVKIDPVQLDQVLANLTVNARDAIAGVGQIVIGTANTTLDESDCAGIPSATPGDYVVLTVSDNGCGMDSETLARAFEPFFTTKEVGQGTGLGLPTVLGIAEQNNGFVSVQSQLGRGSTFRVYLPRASEGEEKAPGEHPPETPRARGETVLLVEDEPAILDVGRMMLERLGYVVLAAGKPSEAIRLSHEYAGEIHLVLTDVVMPEMSGRELMERLQASRPGLKCLFMSGYTADAVVRRGVSYNGTRLVQKPFSLHDLAVRVRAALDGA